MELCLKSILPLGSWRKRQEAELEVAEVFRFSLFMTWMGSGMNIMGQLMFVLEIKSQV